MNIRSKALETGLFGLTLLVVGMGATPALAQLQRVVVLAKVSVDGKIHDESALEAKVQATVRASGLRTVDLGAALRGRRFALSDSVQAGELPKELSTFEADAVASYQLACDKAGDSTWKEKRLKPYYCTLSTKVIVVDSGDVIFNNAESWMRHGLNAAMAVGQAVSFMGEHLEQGVAAYRQVSGWNLDLTVAGIDDDARAAKLETLLDATPGVSATLVTFKQPVAKYALRGDDRAVRKALPRALAEDPQLPLRVTFRTARVLYAQFDFAKAYRFGTLTLSISPAGDPDGAHRARGADLLISELSNLPYLAVSERSATSANSRTQARRERELLRRARSRGLKILLVSSLLPDKEGWSSQLKLLSVKGQGRPLAAASGHGGSAGEAIASAGARLDEDFRAALGKPDVQELLELSEEAARAAVASGLKIRRFETVGRPGNSAQASLTLQNIATGEIVDGEITFKSTDRVLDQRPLKRLAIGESTTLDVPLQGLPSVGDDHVEIAVEIAYRVGEARLSTSRLASFLPPEPPLTRAYREAMESAWESLDSRDFVKARTHAQRAREQVPTAKSLLLIGLAELGLQNYGASLEQLRKALKAERYKLQRKGMRAARRAIREAEAGRSALAKSQ